MGAGRLNLRGSKSRPYLELRRLETELSYLEHQVRHLRRVHDGPLQVHRDALPGTGFYDVHRAQLTSPALHRAYELLYPRDEKCLSAQVLAIAGWGGFTSLWLDFGRWESARRPALRGRFSVAEYQLLADWLAEQDVETCRLTGPRPHHRGMAIAPDSVTRAMARMRPHAPRGMRFRLRASAPLT
jgi:hypothetical protein